MANIKISELTELTTKEYEDYLPIVDNSAEETKKITIENLIQNNVDLVAVTNTPPEPVAGKKYYDTSDNRIYTADSSQHWINPQEPIKGIAYTVISDNLIYVYDGTTLVSVGGGVTVHDSYSNSQTEPYSANYVNNTIVSTKTSNQTSAYSTEYANKSFGGTILWTNPSPTSSMAGDTEINLSSDDYDVLEIFFLVNTTDNRLESTKVLKGYNARLTTSIYSSNIYCSYRNINRVSDTKYKTDSNYYGTSSPGTNNSYCIPLYIVGYKTGLF